MSEGPTPDTELPPLTSMPRWEELCAAFHDAWLQGRHLRIEDFLATVPSEKHAALLPELIRIEAAHRRRRGENVQPDEYRARFPTLDAACLPGLLAEPAGASAQDIRTVSTTGYPLDGGPTAAIRCPHCHNSLPFAGDASCSLLCPACGSSFRIEPFHQASTAEEIQVLGRFHLLERVGQGAFGTVWRARDTELDRVVALKIPHASLLAMPGYHERFQREARAAAQLRHPGIVRLYEVVTVAGMPVLVSDFIEGVPLKDLLEVRQLTFREAAQIVGDVAEALDYSHQLGLIHRDVKPGNIMMEFGPPDAAAGRPPDVGRPMVVDFGLALREEAEIVMTAEGQVIGTPAYMSPEQAAGHGHRVDGRSDVYSLGVVLYQLLTGELPFRGSKAMLIHQVLREEPRPPRRINDKIPRDLETICLKAMAKQPTWRYATAGALAADLRRFLKGEPIQARPVGRAERLWRWCRRNPALALTSTLAIGAVLLAVVLSVGLNIQQARALRESRKFSATLALDKGINQCEQGKVGAGMLWLARGLELAPDDAEDLQRTLRTNVAAWRPWVSPLRALLPHGDVVLAVAVGPDGRAAATGGADGTARLWDSSTGLPLGPPLTHEGEVRAVAFSPDGQMLATASGQAAYLWDIATGHRLASLPHEGRVNAVAFSPKGETLLTACADRGAHLWNVADSRPLATFTHKSVVRYVAFYPDGRTVLTGCQDRTARLWDAATGKLRPRSFKHDAQVTALALSPDGKTVVTASNDKTVRIWDADSGILRRLLPQSTVILCLAVSADNRLVLIGGADRLARLWDLRRGRPFGPPLEYPRSVTAAAFGPGGQLLLTTGDETGAQLREALPGAFHHTLTTPDESIRAVAFSRDARLVLTAGGDFTRKTGTLRLWDPATGKPARPALVHPGLILAAAFRPDGGALLTGATDNRAHLFDVVTGKPLCSPLEHKSWVYAVAFSDDSRHALTGSDDRTAQLYDARNGKYLATFPHTAAVLVVTFSPDGKLALTGTAGKRAVLWDVAGRQRLHTLQHRGDVKAVAFSPDGKAVLTASTDRTAQLWRAATGTPFGEAMTHADTVLAAVFSPGGKRVLTGSGDRTARLWDAATGRPLGPPLLHQGAVSVVAFHPTRPMVLTGSEDQTARLWDAVTGKPLGPAFTHERKVASVAFSPDGALLATGGEDQVAQVWQTPGILKEDAQTLRLWVEVITGMELDRHDAVRPLGPDAWRERLQLLRARGGAPLP